jgi:DNA-binding winged helix-turn-helix (wHTH) protein
MSRPVYRFGSYRLDRAARELRRDGERVAATQKVIDALVWLIEHRDRAVGRDELIAAVWGRVDVSDTHLGKTMFQVRRAIGDSGDDQGMILTVPRFGYRWIAPVVVEDAAPVTGPPTPMPGPQPVAMARPAHAAQRTRSEPSAAVRPPAVRAGRHLAAGAVALVVVATLLIWTGVRDRNPPALAPPSSAAVVALPTGALAVLPVDIHGEGEWAWLRLGLMDLIAQRQQTASILVVVTTCDRAPRRSSLTLSQRTSKVLARAKRPGESCRTHRQQPSGTLHSDDM